MTTNREPHPTIATYIKDNWILEVPVRRGDSAAPVIKLPLTLGWKSAGTDTPDWACDAIQYEGSNAEEYTPSIIALMSKLVGDIDPEVILERASGELRNFPGFKLIGEGAKATLSGFDAYQLGGTWVREGVTMLVAQKTVVIPAQDGLYVLQLNADGLKNQMGILMDATTAIDDHITIRV